MAKNNELLFKVNIQGEKKVFKSLEELEKEVSTLDKNSDIEINVQGQGIDQTFKGLENTKKGLEGVGEGTKSAGKSFKNFDNILKGSGIFALVSILIEIIQELGILDTLFAALKPAIEPLAQVIQDVFGTLGAILGPIIKDIVQALMPAFKALIPIVEAFAPILQIIGKAIELVVTTVFDAVKGFNNFRESLGPLGKILTGLVAPIFLVKDALGALSDSLSGIFGDDAKQDIEAYNKQQKQLTLEIEKQEAAAERTRGSRESLLQIAEQEGISEERKNKLLKENIELSEEESKQRIASAQARVTQIQNEINKFGQTQEKLEELAEAEKELETQRADAVVRLQDALTLIADQNTAIAESEELSVEQKKEQIKQNNEIVKQKKQELLELKQQDLTLANILKKEADRIGLVFNAEQQAQYEALQREIKNLELGLDALDEQQNKTFEKIDTEAAQQALEAQQRALAARVQAENLALQKIEQSKLEGLEKEEALADQRLEIFKAEREQALAQEDLTAQERANIEEEYRLKVEESNQQLQAFKDEKRKEELEAEKAAAEKRLELEKQFAEQQRVSQEEAAQTRLERTLRLQEEEFNASLDQIEDFFEQELAIINFQEQQKLEANKRATEKALEENSKLQEEELNKTEEFYKQGIISKTEFEKEKKRISEKFTDQETEILANAEKEKLEIQKNSIEQREQLEAQAQEEFLDSLTENIQIAQEAVSLAFDALGEVFARGAEQLQADLDVITERADAQSERVNELQEAAANATGEQKKAALSALNSERKAEQKLQKEKMKAEKELAKEKRKQAVAEKANALIQAGIQTALGIIAAQKEAFPLNLIKSVLVGATGATQAAIIASQPIPQFAEGGFTKKGHKNEVAGIVHAGEYVVPKKMVDSPKFSPTISKLESARTRGYADGGLVRDAEKSLENAKSPVVSVLDIVDGIQNNEEVFAEATLD